jgi:hypothetical protein
MSIKSGNLGVKYPTAWIQIDQFTLQTAFPDTRNVNIRGTSPRINLDGIEAGGRKLAIQEDTGDIFIRTETGAPLIRIATAGNDAKIGILDGVNTLVLDKLHAIGVHPALALDDKGGFGTTHRIVSKQSELIIQDDFLGIDLVTISSITQDMFVNNGKVGALAGVVVAVQDKFHAIGVSPALRLEGIEAGAKTYRIREDAGALIIRDETALTDRYRISASGDLIMTGAFRFIPATDNTGNIGTAVNRWALVRAVTITSGRHEFEDKFYIEEDDESLRFHDYKTNELLMKLDKQGNLYIKGSVYKL